MPRRRSAKRSTRRRTAKRSTRRRSARRSACRGWKWPWAFGERPKRKGGFFVRGQDGEKEKKLIKPISYYKR